MKVGILTYHIVCNFGAQLQAISTVGFLKREGHEPVVINWYPKDLDEKYQKEIPLEQYKCHIDFAKQNMPLTKLCRTEDELLQVIEENNFDAIILGSDALFKFLPKSARKIFSFRKLRFVDRCIFTSDQELAGNPFWGSFIPKLKNAIPVVVFSVSSQNTAYKKVNEQEYDGVKKSLERFKYITVRDEWTKQLVQYFLGKIDIPVTPDPVFSFNQNTYLPVLSKQKLIEKYKLPNKYVLLSFRLKRIGELFVKEIADRLIANGYTPVAFPHPEGLEDYGCAHKISMPLSPLEWYYLIKYSDGYIGERMHPIIVSLHNTVPFFCFDEYGMTKIIKIFPYIYFKKLFWKSSKIYHILSKADLLDNVVSIKHLPKITPQMAVERFLTFDKQKVSVFLEKQQQEYENYMNNLLEHCSSQKQSFNNK